MQTIPLYESEGLWKRLKKSAQEHGYHSVIWYGIIRYKDMFLSRLQMHLPWNGLRVTMQRWRGVHVGKGVHIAQKVDIESVYPEFVVLEDYSALSGQNLILTHNKTDLYHCRAIRSFIAPVILRRHAVLSVGVTVLPGVEIGEGSIISANSLVKQDIPPFVLAGGNPAVVIADISRFLRQNYTPEEFDRILAERKAKFNI